jgi:HlyD family secretion protein
VPELHEVVAELTALAPMALPANGENHFQNPCEPDRSLVAPKQLGHGQPVVAVSIWRPLKVFFTVLISIAMVLGLLVLGGAYYYRSIIPADAPVVVKSEPVEFGDLFEAVAAPGEIQSLRRVGISAKVAAPIVEMPHKEGEQVYGPGPTTQASLLVRLDDKDLQAVRRQLMARQRAQEEQLNVAKQRIVVQQATLRANRATIADLARDLKRNQELLATHDVSQSVVDTAQSKYDEQMEQINAAEASIIADQINLKVMEQGLEAARAEVSKADEDISYTTIRSPIDGTLISVKAQVGEMVVTGTMNNAGTMILEVADLSTMLMVAHVHESQIEAVNVGQKATVRIGAYRDKIFTGTVRTVAESRTEDKSDLTRYFEVKILLDLKGSRIRSGLSADAEIETSWHKGVLKVPNQSVMGRPVDQLPEELRTSKEIEKGKSYATVVYRMIDGKAVATPVTVGPSDDKYTIISSGLTVGDRVIVGPYKVLESLLHGQAVKTDSGGPMATTQPSTQPTVNPTSRLSLVPK